MMADEKNDTRGLQMPNSLPNISRNVIDVLLKLYKLNEDHLLNMLATSPMTSVLRVNACHANANEAIAQLQMYLKSLSEKTSYVVSQHPLLKDVLLVRPENEGSTNHQCYEKEVIVDTSCGSAVLRGADIFAPGVLAAHPGMKKGDTVSVYVDLGNKCRRGFIKQFDGEKYFLGNGVALFARHQLFENNSNLKGIAVEMACPNQHPSFSSLDTSLFFPQNLPSVVVGHILNPQNDDLVLDMCASPGGKTTHLASLLKNKGCIISIDKTQKKVDRIKTNCHKLGLSNVKTFCYDSTMLVDESCQGGSSSALPEQPPFPPDSFDKILLDPPCSGLGQRPQLRYVMTNKELQSYPIYQRRLLKQAIFLLKPGGCLVFSTCTLLPQENEEQVAWVLANFPEMKLDHQTPFIGRPGLDGFGLTEGQCENVQRFDWCYLPSKDQTVNVDTNRTPMDPLGTSSDHDTIGFFIAKFIKTDK